MTVLYGSRHVPEFRAEADPCCRAGDLSLKKPKISLREPIERQPHQSGLVHTLKYHQLK